MTPLLDVRDLHVRFDGGVEALRGVSFTLDRGETLAVVGETGSGKSTLASSLIGLIQPPYARGSIRFDGEELLGASGDTLVALRWDRVAISLQGVPFNPVVTVGDQVAEPLRQRAGMSRNQARQRASELADEALLDPTLLSRYPHELSGGERRRATLAMVLALDPDLVVLDEPTAGLDPTTGHALVDRLIELVAARGLSVVVVSHNLPDAARLADRTLVLYAGEVLEAGSARDVMTDPVHPYSWALVHAFPVMTTTKDLHPIRGHPPDPRAVPSGCAYHPRCPQAEPICSEERPPLAASRGRSVACHFGGLKELLVADHLHKSFRSRKGEVKALVDASLTLRAGEAVGVVGPSGSGKTTWARVLSGHLAPDHGQVLVEGLPLLTGHRPADREARRRVQLVMQDPWDALSPRLTVEQLIREPLDLGDEGDRADSARILAEALRSVGLPSSGPFLSARSHELSGGQLQRVSLARALVARPVVLVADEPTSMLDASEQARLLLVLRDRQVEMGLGLVLVSHDVALVRKVTDRIVVLDGGRVVEEGPSNTVSTVPTSEAAHRLIDAAPAFTIAERPLRDSVPSDETG